MFAGEQQRTGPTELAKKSCRKSDQHLQNKEYFVPKNSACVIAKTLGKVSTVCVSLCLTLFLPCAASADAVTDWNVNAAKAALAACIEPPGSNDPAHESRMYAMMHVAIHDALNAIDRRFRPYVFNVQGPTGASREAAVASAARNVLVPVISELPFVLRHACRPASPASKPTIPRQLRHSRIMRPECKAFR